jgi:NAD(P)-dependent dehydrogenase (short-subunit alcohol dehydrogenase family)
MKLKDKVAVVTGAGQGMGRAIAQLFAREGAKVIALDLKLDNAQQTVAGSSGVARRLNVADPAAVKALFDEVVAEHGRVDVLVNNAGIGGLDKFIDTSDEAWARVIAINLNGAFYCAREAARAMVASGRGGAVINIASSAAASGDGPVHYCASKAGLMGLTRGMARELAPHQIRVNTIVPGPTNTPMMAGVPEAWAQSIIRGVPLGRMGEPEDIARAALFLASDDSGFVTGQNIAVNGGCVFF